MELVFEELTHENFEMSLRINRDDISEAFVDTANTIMETTDYGVLHYCVGHTFLVKHGGEYIGIILLGEALHWETDPPEMLEQPFYRLMGFVIDKRFRGRGIGKEILETTIDKVYADFGQRPIALGCHKDNVNAAAFYKRNGFIETNYREGNDIYYLRYPSTHSWYDKGMLHLVDVDEMKS